MRMMGDDAIAILPAAPEAVRNRDVHYPYRQDSDLYYVTGFGEPEAIAVICPGRDHGEFVMFCRERDPAREVWNGRRAGVDGVVERYGADDAFPIGDVDDILPGTGTSYGVDLFARRNVGEWTGWAPTALLGGRIAGRRLGIIGMGRVGQVAAQRFRGLGMTVRYHNRSRLPAEQEQGAIYHEDLDDMLGHCDVVSLHCPATPETENLMNAERLALLPDGAVVEKTAFAATREPQVRERVAAMTRRRLIRRRRRRQPPG